MKRLLLVSVLAAATGYANTASAVTWTYNLPTSIASYYDSVHAVENVLYIDAWGDLNDLQYTASTHQWTFTVVASVTGQHPCAIGTGLVAFFDGSEGHVYCDDPTRHLLEYAGNPPSTFTDITAATSGGAIWGPSYTYRTCSCCPAICRNNTGFDYASTLAGFYASGEAHVFYPAGDAALHESYYSGGWHDRAIAGPGTSFEQPGQFYASNGEGMSSLWDGSFGHVYYMGDDANFYALTESSGTWSSTQLAIGSNVPLGFQSSSSPLSSGRQYIFGSSSLSGPAYEFYNNGSGWNEFSLSETNFTWVSPDLSYNAAGNIQFFYIGSNEHVYDGNTGYDITQNVGAALVAYDANLPTPPSGEHYEGLSRMTGFWDGSCRHIFYVAGDSYVHEMYSCQSSGDTGWFEHNIQQAVATVPAAD